MLISARTMYVRATSRRAKEGTAVRYLQLAHNEWDASAGISRPKILFSFGREDSLDRGAIERLAASLTRLLDPAAAAALTCPDGLAGRVAAAGRHVHPGRAVAAAADRRGDARPAGRPQAGPAGRAGAVRAGREPGAGRVVEAGGGWLDHQ